MSGPTIGTVAGLWRYPVKSMGDEPLESVDVSWHGVVGDRRWAFIQDGKERSGFPWLTIRELPAMRHYLPFFSEPERPDASRTMVRTPSGAELEVVDPALAAELGDGVRVIRQKIGVFREHRHDALQDEPLGTLAILAQANLIEDERRGEHEAERCRGEQGGARRLRQAEGDQHPDARGRAGAQLHRPLTPALPPDRYRSAAGIRSVVLYIAKFIVVCCPRGR